jgi:hypothetical protein
VRARTAYWQFADKSEVIHLDEKTRSLNGG